MKYTGQANSVQPLELKKNVLNTARRDVNAAKQDMSFILNQQNEMIRNQNIKTGLNVQNAEIRMKEQQNRIDSLLSNRKGKEL